jgi:hypothetical protein
MPKTRSFPEYKTHYTQIIGRLWERLDEPFDQCRLGREPRCKNRCSACTHTKAKFELDHAVASLIENGTFAVSTVCPYRVFAGELLLALMAGPLILEGLCDLHRRTAEELEIALKHLRRGIRLYNQFPWVTMWMEKEYHSIVQEVITAQQSIDKALKTYRTKYLFDQPSQPKSERGRGKDLERQTIVQGCAAAWERLTGSRAGKTNTNFQDVLSAASATVLGVRDSFKGWEWQIKVFEERLKNARRKSDKEL